MDEKLKAVRESAVGLEADEELLARFPVKEVTTVMLPTGLEEDAKVFLYEPLNRTGITPMIINMHGGGYVKGYRGRDIVFSQNLAWHTGCLVADIDYKTAPEKKYPYAFNECYAVAKYFSAHAAEYNVDPSRIILSGFSAGGTLALAVAMLAKKQDEIHPALIIAGYPPIDLVTDPVAKIPAGSDLDPQYAARGRMYNAWYCDEERRGEIYASPLYATREDLQGLPPVLLLTGGKDDLGPEGNVLASHLIEANVPVTARCFPTAKHGFVVRRAQEYLEAEAMIFSAVEQVKHPLVPENP